MISQFLQRLFVRGKFQASMLCCAFFSTLLDTPVEKCIITFFPTSLSAELRSTMNEKLSIVSNDAI